MVGFKAAVSGKSDLLLIISYSKVMNTSLLALRTQKSLHVCNAFAFRCRTSWSTPFLPIIPITTPCCLWHLCSTISAFRKELGELHREAHPPVRGSFPLIQGCPSSFRYFQISFLGGHRRRFPGWTDSVPRSRGMSESIQPSSASRTYDKVWSKSTKTCWDDVSVYLLLSQEPVLPTQPEI